MCQNRTFRKQSLQSLLQPNLQTEGLEKRDQHAKLTLRHVQLLLHVLFRCIEMNAYITCQSLLHSYNNKKVEVVLEYEKSLHQFRKFRRILKPAIFHFNYILRHCNSVIQPRNICIFRYGAPCNIPAFIYHINFETFSFVFLVFAQLTKFINLLFQPIEAQ